MERIKMTKSAAARQRERRKNLFILSIIAFQLVNFIIFYLCVNLNSILLAFKLNVEGGAVKYTLENFRQMFQAFGNQSSDLLLSLRNTIIFFVFGIVMLPISFLTSYFMYKKIRCYKAFRIIFFLPSVLSAVVWTNLYKNIIGVEGPIADLFAQLAHLQEVPVFLANAKYALTAVVMYSFWLGIANNFVLFSGTLTRIPDSVIEAGKLDGISWFREMTQMIVPLIWPTLATMILIQLTGLFNSSGNILLLTGGDYGTNTISFYIFQRVYGNAETSNTYNYASAVGVFFTVIALPIVFVAKYLMNKVEDVQY